MSKYLCIYVCYVTNLRQWQGGLLVEPADLKLCYVTGQGHRRTVLVSNFVVEKSETVSVDGGSSMFRVISSVFWPPNDLPTWWTFHLFYDFLSAGYVVGEVLGLSQRSIIEKGLHWIGVSPPAPLYAGFCGAQVSNGIKSCDHFWWWTGIIPCEGGDEMNRSQTVQGGELSSRRNVPGIDLLISNFNVW